MIINHIFVYALLAPGLFCLLPLDLSIFALYRLFTTTIRKIIVCRIVSPFLRLLGRSWFPFASLMPALLCLHAVFNGFYNASCAAFSLPGFLVSCCRWAPRSPLSYAAAFGSFLRVYIYSLCNDANLAFIFALLQYQKAILGTFYPSAASKTYFKKCIYSFCFYI